MLLFVFVFGYCEIKLFKKNLQIDCYNIFNITCVLEKYWYVLEMFLNCSWIFISKITGHPLIPIQKQYIQSCYWAAKISWRIEILNCIVLTIYCLFLILLTCVIWSSWFWWVTHSQGLTVAKLKYVHIFWLAFTSYARHGLFRLKHSCKLN